jgi:hypothetical protein
MWGSDAFWPVPTACTEDRYRRVNSTFNKTIMNISLCKYLTFFGKFAIGTYSIRHFWNIYYGNGATLESFPGKYCILGKCPLKIKHFWKFTVK